MIGVKNWWHDMIGADHMVFPRCPEISSQNEIIQWKSSIYATVNAFVTMIGC